MSFTTPVKVDVFVSGAGPVGLFFAYQMASRGHSVYCVDLKSGPTNQSRAISITSRSMEILEARGLASRILAESVVASGVRFYRYGVLVSSSALKNESTTTGQQQYTNDLNYITLIGWAA